VSEKYEFIDAEYADNSAAPSVPDAPTIVQMCTWLSASKSGFYEWRGRPVSATARRRELLQAKITERFDDSDGTYGYRRVHAALARSGEQVSPELVRKLMRQLGLVPCQPRPYRTTTVRGDQASAGDLLGRDFTADEPGTKLVSDITYVWGPGKAGCIWPR
jgi:putative transposase